MAVKHLQNIEQERKKGRERLREREGEKGRREKGRQREGERKNISASRKHRTEQTPCIEKLMSGEHRL